MTTGKTAPDSKATANRETSSRATNSQQTSQSASMAAYFRAENEDDDGYDPYSDRPAAPEPLFERDPWS